MEKFMGGKFELTLFDGKNNFALWQSMVKDLLIQQGLHTTLEDKKPTDVDKAKWDNMKLRAASTIRLALAPEIKYDVLEIVDPKVLWDKLAKTYQSKSLANKLFLKKDLFGLKMEEDGDLRDHLNRFNGLITQLNHLDEKLEDEDKAIHLLVSLPEKYNNVITSLMIGRTELALDETIVVLLEAERLMKQGESSSYDGALVVEARDKKKGFGKKHNPNIKCFYCNELGHIQTICPKAKEDLKKLKKTRGKGVAAIIEEGDEFVDEDLLLVQENKELNEEDNWVLDSGSSHHICSRREWFSSYKECEGKMVTLPDGRNVKIKGIGEVVIRLHDGQVRKFGDVRYIPKIKRNLISVGRLDKLGYTAIAQNGSLEVTKGGKVILKGQKNNKNLFILDGKVLVQGETLFEENMISCLQPLVSGWDCIGLKGRIVGLSPQYNEASK